MLVISIALNVNDYAEECVIIFRPCGESAGVLICKMFCFKLYLTFVLSSAEGRAVGAAAAVSLSGKVPLLASAYGNSGSAKASRGWLSGVFALPVAGLNDLILFLSSLFCY